MIPNGDSGDFQGVGLGEVLCKAFTSLLNQRLTASITLHDVLHRFWVSHGMGTTAIKAKLLQQLTYMRKAVLFEVFLDI